jgi:hypothetical protein
MFGEYCIKDKYDEQYNKTYTAVKCTDADISDGKLPKWKLIQQRLQLTPTTTSNDIASIEIDFRKIRPIGFMARARALRADSKLRRAFDEQFTFDLSRTNQTG